MLSQFTWLQFFLFVGGAAALWYVYVLFVYYGSSINKAITQPREEAAVAVPIARRPVSRSIIQTEDFSQSPPAQQPEQEPDPALVLEEEETPQESISVPVPPSVLDDTAPAVVITTDDISGGEDLSSETSVGDDMSPAVRAALSGQSYNWAESPALNMDYREPDEKGIEEIATVEVSQLIEEEQSGEDYNAVDADDYATTVVQLVQPEISPETKETVLSSLQNITGNAFISDLVQRSKNAACNLTRAFGELADRGQLSEIQSGFRDRFLSPASGDSSLINTANASPPAIDGEDLSALLDSLS